MMFKEQLSLSLIILFPFSPASAFSPTRPYPKSKNPINSRTLINSHPFLNNNQHSVETQRGILFPIEKNSSKSTSLSLFNFNKDKNANDFISTQSESKGNPYEALINRPVLAIIDFISLVTFAAIGKASHAPDGSLDVIGVSITAFPFLLSWFTITPLIGCYNPSPKDLGSIKQLSMDVLINAGKGWALAVPMGCVLRGVFKGYVPPTPFVIVTLISTAIIIGGTRVLYTIISNKLNELSKFQSF